MTEISHSETTSLLHKSQHASSDHRPNFMLPGWKKYSTVELIIFFVLLAIVLSNNITVDLIIYQTCRIHETTNTSVCDILHDNSSSQAAIELQGKIQPHTSLILILQSVITTIYPAFLCFYLGPWSDKNGRKPVLRIALIGHALEYMILCVLSMMNVNPYWYLISPIVSNLFGGFPAIVMSCVCYVSDISDRDTRAWHLMWFDAAYISGTLVGILLAPILVINFGYVAVYAVATACLLFCCLYTHFYVPETIINQERTSIFDKTLLKESISAAVTKREGFDRDVVWKCIIGISLQVVILQGGFQVIFMFTNIRLGWNIKDFSIFSSVANMISVAGSLILVKLIKALGLPDTVNVIVASLSIFASSMMKAFTLRPEHLYFSAGIGMFATSTAPVLRAIVSKFVPHRDIGKIFSLITSMEMIIPFATTPLYIWVYTKFPPPIYPCPAWFLSAFMGLVIFILTCLVQYKISRKNRGYTPVN